MDINVPRGFLKIDDHNIPYVVSCWLSAFALPYNFPTENPLLMKGCRKSRYMLDSAATTVMAINRASVESIRKGWGLPDTLKLVPEERPLCGE